MDNRNDGAARDSEEVTRVAREIAGRLAAVGVVLSGKERPEELVELEEAVERFERAVEARGGDLMVDEGPRGRTSEPDNPHFALPLRRAHEAVSAYLGRLSAATKDVLKLPQRP